MSESQGGSLATSRDFVEGNDNNTDDLGISQCWLLANEQFDAFSVLDNPDTTDDLNGLVCRADAVIIAELEKETKIQNIVNLVLETTKGHETLMAWTTFAVILSVTVYSGLISSTTLGGKCGKVAEGSMNFFKSAVVVIEKALEILHKVERIDQTLIQLLGVLLQLLNLILRALGNQDLFYSVTTSSMDCIHVLALLFTSQTWITLERELHRSDYSIMSKNKVTKAHTILLRTVVQSAITTIQVVENRALLWVLFFFILNLSL